MSVSPDLKTTGPSPVAAAGDGESLLRKIDRADLMRTAFVAICAVAVALGLTGPWRAAPLIAIVGLVVGCWPILIEAWEDVWHRRMSMELSMLIAIVAAAAIGEWITALVVTTFVLAAEILEDLSLDRGRDALTDLMSFLPATVQIRDGAELRTVPLDSLRPGQTVIVSPGAGVPVDGTVVLGRSSVDQSRITGESLPVNVEPGSSVFAGSVNQVGALEIEAERVGAESSYGQIIDAVRAAQASQAPVQRLADRLASYLVYLALGGAAITFLVTRDITATISVIIVAGACGIAAGTPLAVLAAIGRAASNGAFIKGGTHLEALSSVDTVIFDKTGTLTEGAPQVVAVHPAPGTTEDQVLIAAATAEMYSEHPLGKAIVAQAQARRLPLGLPESFDYEPGRGLSAHVDGRLVQIGNTTLVPGARQSADSPTLASATAVHVATDGAFMGTIFLADTVRASACQCVADLRSMGLRVVMLTGDSHVTGRAVAAEVGIENVRTDLLPSDKLAAVDAERAAGHKVAMVGDGVNDAPALAHATVGIAMGSGTEVARQSADIVLISSDLADLTHAVRVARRARRIVMTNFVGTIAIDLVGIMLAAFGILGPVLAAIIHVSSESVFILNAARLVPGGRTGTRSRPQG
ncbi:copper-(or silver)-translocating P-type ATPase/heavy metal-(Cd/Co/Hg/Pb/Zn)-translocating P-type ATPase,TIGR01512 [Sanguibacter gelidistatuariae]|uniref:Copper-(Or silver)-translocating P-type ATPase/heavy metal-(Cd/Co/Hg/Pb/Zn)-translocating P-type ATPase,TIGR01512 n=1 Tax=Sanguibacter gelidistatuariae TaxID=1814289 RepID=A0A1G6SW82_9MICO|nr:cation-translocating P-type ATPase [Sanguibacter gelidistatuariae]SDD21220.1 copper-(or silver)-translocating P-type ATPase/heavy metal-(Cd/Co/Hg/Pb/Zn)-translocating P-type ATPase,TIGR01512 [Sanguibacter gelidistatuariae]